MLQRGTGWAAGWLWAGLFLVNQCFGRSRTSGASALPRGYPEQLWVPWIPGSAQGTGEGVPAMAGWHQVGFGDPSNPNQPGVPSLYFNEMGSFGKA